ncbi:hypothetical protein EMN47_01320 [Prolixibacteraceae bacterium JC049]|nr:hypothetical protein [Prolixibacteraceae bacterium JC049]
MRHRLTLLLAVLVLGLQAQERNWKVETSKDGSVVVKSDIVNDADIDGKKGKVIHYIVEKTGGATLVQMEQFLRDSKNYKNIWENTKESKELKRITNNEWISYLFFKTPWPMANNDCVHRMYFESKGENGFSLKGKAEPNAYAKKKADRLTYYDMEFKVTKVGAGRTKLTLTVSYGLTSDVPKFLLKGWFPKGPIGIINRVFEHAVK